MNKDKIEQLVTEIIYAQDKKVEITHEDWVKKIEALNKPEDKPERIEELNRNDIYDKRNIADGDYVEKINECIRAINKLNKKRTDRSS